MNPAANQRVSPNRVVLILALLLGVWLVFQFLPQKQPAPPPVMAVTESKLHAVGLAENPDWDGLPEFFAIVEKEAEWKDGRTRFAYWHPVMKTYSYYFEATRSGEGVRFKEIAEPHDPDHYWDEEMTEDSPVRFYLTLPTPIPPRPPLSYSESGGRDVRFKVNVDSTTPNSPPIETKIPPVVPVTKP